MEVKITEKKENILLGRIEIKAHIKFSGATPSNVLVTEALAKEFKSTPELVLIKHIYNQFSLQEALVTAEIYKTAESKKKVQVNKKQKKAKVEGEQAAAPAKKGK